MTPPAIVRAALRAGLDLIGVTDHNSAANAAAVLAAARGTPLKVLPGMEVQTKEEVHLVCLFARAGAALAWQEAVYRRLPPKDNEEAFFGAQLLLDARGRERRREKRLLLTSAALTVTEAVAEVLARGGLVIPAHVDRPAYSLIGMLGFLPPDLPVTALEVSRPENARQVAGDLAPQSRRLALVAASDAHTLADIGRCVTAFYLRSAALSEISRALRGAGGRKVVIEPFV